jgi:hypothetical protein
MFKKIRHYTESFAKVSKNVARCKSENNFVGPSDHNYEECSSMISVLQKVLIS